MRKPLIVTAAILAMAVFPARAAAAPPDTTTGTGTQDFGTFTQTVHVNAKSEEGLNPRGHFFLRETTPSSTFKRHGDVTCHSVLGNATVVGGIFRTPVSGRQGVLIFINDDGKPGAGQDDLLVEYTFFPTRLCPDPSEIEFPIEKGNFTVHDR